MMLAALATCAPQAWAQQESRVRAGAARVRVDAVTATSAVPGSDALAGVGALVGAGAPRFGGAPLGDAERRRWAPVASLILPGAGQALLAQDRFVAYLALEAWSVLEFANQRTEARRQRNRYQTLAREVARSLYGPSHPVGTWDYYENMEKYLESGVFDRLPGGEVDPDLDERTFNGFIWLQARATFWVDPNVPPPQASAEYRRAMNFYLDRAVRPEYRWSWRNAQLEQDLYIRTIRRSNMSGREARAALGIALANHLLSAVDAVITLRVEGLEGGTGRGFAVRGSLPIP
jgi:hypothetical protein